MCKLQQIQKMLTVEGIIIILIEQILFHGNDTQNKGMRYFVYIVWHFIIISLRNLFCWPVKDSVTGRMIWANQEKHTVFILKAYTNLSLTVISCLFRFYFLLIFFTLVGYRSLFEEKWTCPSKYTSICSENRHY